MSSQQYLRSASIVVADATGNGIDLSDFKVRFEVRRGDMQTPNSADVRVFNLSDTTASAIRAEFTQLAIQAGYGENLALIFRGSICQTRKGRIDQKDSYVDITAADGDEAYNYSSIAITLAANSTPAQGLQAIIQAMGTAALGGAPSSAPPVTAGTPAPSLPQNASLRARTYFGLSRDELRDFAATHGINWSIQNGAVTLVPDGTYLPGAPVLITPSTGLIGVPEQTEHGLAVRVLLNPQIKIGQLVQLDSSDINQYRYGLDLESQRPNLRLAQSSTKLNADGFYYVMRADHIGDTRGEEWYTELTCLAVDASVPNELLSGVAVGPLPVWRF